MDLSYVALHTRFGPGISCSPTFSFPTSIIDAHALARPTHPAIHFVAPDFASERIVSYAELSDLSHRAAVVFASLGLNKGDRVMVQLGRRVEWWVVLFGLMRIGVVPIPGTSLLVGKGSLPPREPNEPLTRSPTCDR